MMKRALLLLSLLAIPCVVTSCKDDNIAAPITAANMLSPLDKLCQYKRYCDSTDKEINMIRAGYKGDTATLDNLTDARLNSAYCTGAAADGNVEQVMQCLDKGADPNEGLWGAAYGGHMEIVWLLLEMGATNYKDALSAAEKFGQTECGELIREVVGMREKEL